MPLSARLVKGTFANRPPEEMSEIGHRGEKKGGKARDVGGSHDMVSIDYKQAMRDYTVFALLQEEITYLASQYLRYATTVTKVPRIASNHNAFKRIFFYKTLAINNRLII